MSIGKANKINGMEIGKKYIRPGNYNSSVIYECIGHLPDGKPIVQYQLNNTWLVGYANYVDYIWKEYKEPKPLARDYYINDYWFYDPLFKDQRGMQLTTSKNPQSKYKIEWIEGQDPKFIKLT